MTLDQYPLKMGIGLNEEIRYLTSTRAGAARGAVEVSTRSILCTKAGALSTCNDNLRRLKSGLLLANKVVFRGRVGVQIRLVSTENTRPLAEG